MKQHSVTRLVAVATLTCLLAAFALPAAAAPFGGTTAEGLWSPLSLVRWVQTVWAAWLGADEDAPDSSGIGNVHANLENAMDPDGRQVFQAGTEPDSEELSSPSGSFGTTFE